MHPGLIRNLRARPQHSAWGKAGFWSGLKGLTVACIVLVWTVPTLGLFVSSLRPEAVLLESGWWQVLWQPAQWGQLSWANYHQVLTRGQMGQAFVNSWMIALPATGLSVAIATLTAYTLVWLPLPRRSWWLAGIIGLLAVPLQTTFIPILRLYNQLGLSGTFAAVWLAHTAYSLPFGIYLLRNFMAELPKDLIEAAIVDGASPLQVLRRLVLPLSKSAIASFAVFQFLWVWNDLIVALVYLGGNPQVAPMTLVLRNLVGDRAQDWHLLTAGAFISMAVPMLVFWAMQRYFVKGLLAGSLKG
jgi:alpha-glucoside transport system permease protein